MSLFSKLLNSLSGKKESAAVSERPCSNCPSDCAVAGNACSICEPYKKKLIDQIYLIDHIDEYYSRYEVTGITGETAVNCPYCGARSGNPFICEYCGSKLSEATGKIRVEKASDIPNPVTDAQDIIFERADVIAKYASGTSGSSGNSIFSSLVSFLNESAYTDTQNPLGAKMSESEIKEAASLYGVSVSDYLTGLDNGKYLTLAGKKAEGLSASTEYTGIPGVAGIGMLAGAMLGNNGFGYRPRHRDNRDDKRPAGNVKPPIRQEPYARRPDVHPKGRSPQRPGPGSQGPGSHRGPAGGPRGRR